MVNQEPSRFVINAASEERLAAARRRSLTARGYSIFARTGVGGRFADGAPSPYRLAAAITGPQPAPCTIAASARPASPPGTGKLAASPRHLPSRTISRTTSL